MLLLTSCLIILFGKSFSFTVDAKLSGLLVEVGCTHSGNYLVAFPSLAAVYSLVSGPGWAPEGDVLFLFESVYRHLFQGASQPNVDFCVLRNSICWIWFSREKTSEWEWKAGFFRDWRKQRTFHLSQLSEGIFLQGKKSGGKISQT